MPEPTAELFTKHTAAWLMLGDDIFRCSQIIDRMRKIPPPAEPGRVINERITEQIRFVFDKARFAGADTSPEALVLATACDELAMRSMAEAARLICAGQPGSSFEDAMGDASDQAAIYARDVVVHLPTATLLWIPDDLVEKCLDALSATREANIAMAEAFQAGPSPRATLELG